MKRSSCYFIFALSLLLSFVMSACSSSPLEPKSTFSYTISASSDINPDIRNQPSSVVVKVVQLLNMGNFKNASYESIFSGLENKLGSELIAMEEHLIDPDSTQTFKLELSKRTQFLGVAVGYRQADAVTWKAVHPIPKTSLLDPRSLLGNEGMFIKVEKSNIQIITK